MQTTDAIDWSGISVLNSPDIRDWPITSDVTLFGLAPDALRIEHTKQGVWPAVPFQDAAQEATVWIFLNIGGRWYGSGVERLRPGQTNKPEGLPSQLAANWYYDSNRWGAMVGHQPMPGEVVGFCVASGDTRNTGGNISTRERSAIRLYRFPGDSGQVPMTPIDPSHGSTTPETPTTPTTTTPHDDDEIVQAIDALTVAVESLDQGLRALVQRVDTLAAQGIGVHLGR